MPNTTTVFVVALAVALTGCGRSAQEKKMEEAARAAGQAGQALQEGATKMADAMKQLEGAGKDQKNVEPVDFRELKALLPESIDGMAKKDARGERTGVMGVKVSEASAEYMNEEGKSIRIKIMDMGSVSGFVGFATLAWAHAEVDRETENGYEKTSTLSGHRTFEKYNTEDKSGDLSVLVAERFVVEIEGNQVTMDELKSAAGTINLGKLESMKNAGVAG